MIWLLKYNKKKQEIYIYESTSLKAAKKIIKYLNKYNLQSNKHVNYLKWRKVYILIKNYIYLTVKGQIKIKKLSQGCKYT